MITVFSYQIEVDRFKMTILVDNLLYYPFAISVTFLAGLVLYYKWSFTYWKKRGLESLEPSIPFGNTYKLFTSKASFGDTFCEFYEKFKAKGLKHGGVFMFAMPFYIPTDPEIIKGILQKDFDHFVDRGFHVNEEVDPLSGNIVLVEGAKWRNLRTKLSPTFTSGKMKMMFEIMVNTAKELEVLVHQATLTKEPMDIKDVVERYTTDNISSCAFGLDSNSLKNPNTEFRYYGIRIFKNTFWENAKVFSQFAFPRWLLDLLKIKFSKPDVERFIMDLVKKTVDYREKNNIYRKDFLHLLLQLKNRGKLSDDGMIHSEDSKNQEETMTMNQLAAQVFLFFAAGYETSATTLTFTLYEISLNQEIQEKLRSEIQGVLEKDNNQITYDAIMNMPYMDQVVNEVLRKHPPFPFLNRICTKTYDVPNTHLRLEEGTKVLISVSGLHRDPEFYPDPLKFDPERFNEENKKSRPAFTWIPFGEGPRICLGLRFGVLQVKIALATILNNYRVTLNSKTKQPLKMDPKSVVTASHTKIWLDISKLDY